MSDYKQLPTRIDCECDVVVMVDCSRPSLTSHRERTDNHAATGIGAVRASVGRQRLSCTNRKVSMSKYMKLYINCSVSVALSYSLMLVLFR